MSEEYFYSATTGGFYPASMKASYKASQNGWPSDAIAVSDDDYKALFEGQAKGKIITADSNGKPVLSDPPAPSQDQLIAQAATQRDSLMAAADAIIKPMQYAVDEDDATDAETERLKAWKKYCVALSRLDLSTAPDIEWPTAPE